MYNEACYPYFGLYGMWPIDNCYQFIWLFIYNIAYTHDYSQQMLSLTSFLLLFPTNHLPKLPRATYTTLHACFPSSRNLNIQNYISIGHFSWIEAKNDQLVETNHQQPLEIFNDGWEIDQDRCILYWWWVMDMQGPCIHWTSFKDCFWTCRQGKFLLKPSQKFYTISK